MFWRICLKYVAALPCFHANVVVRGSIAVSRSKNVPTFGPLFAKDARFDYSSTFRDFLLVKGLASAALGCHV